MNITKAPLVPFIRHLRAEPNMYVQHLHKGQPAHEGPGSAFWFQPRTAALSQVPLDDREQALLFQARTRDFQELTVQATVNYRVVDPGLAIGRVDFGVNPETGRWNGTPLETLGGLLTELAQQPAVQQLSTMTMKEAIVGGIIPVRAAVVEALENDGRLAERGLAVLDFRVVGIETDPEVERTMQTETREQIQQEADRATFERRAVAVERERAISENELQNQIELARQEEELVRQRGTNERRRAEEQAAAEAIQDKAKASRARLLAGAEADATRVVGEAKAEVDAASYQAVGEVDVGVLLALAAQELAANIPAIENLTITPDLLTNALNQLTQGAATGDEVGR